MARLGVEDDQAQNRRSETRSLLERVQRARQRFLDAGNNLVSSSSVPKYEGGEGKMRERGKGGGAGGGVEEEKVEEEKVEESEEEEGEEIPPELEEATETILRLRDEAAAHVWPLWDKPEKKGEMEDWAETAHKRHRDYLHIAYRYRFPKDLKKTKISPLPRKIIDDKAPNRYIRRANRLWELMKEKDRAEEAVLDGEIDQAGQESKKADLNSANKKFAAGRAAFLEWSHNNLSALCEEDVNDTTYRFINDGLGEPLLGDPVPDAAIKKSLNCHRKKAQQLIKRSPSQPLVPFLSTPVELVAEVVAYRHNLLAFNAAPGLYRLVSLGSQFIWTKEMLVEEGVTNASGKGMSRFANSKGLSSTERLELALSCLGLIGVAYKKHRKTLNRKWLIKHEERMGPTMLEVRWMGENGEIFITWETREGWQIFRGKEEADKEINFWARCRAEGKDPTKELEKILRRYPRGTLPRDVPEYDYSDEDEEELWRSPEPSNYTDSVPSSPHHQGNYQPSESETMPDAELSENYEHSASANQDVEDALMHDHYWLDDIF